MVYKYWNYNWKMNIWWNIDIKDGVVSHDSISWIDDNFEINEDTVLTCLKIYYKFLLITIKYWM